MSSLVPVGVITSAHGVRGQVKLKTYIENPKKIADYQTLQDKEANLFAIKVISSKKDMVIVAIENIDDRDKAEALKGTELFISRDELPVTQEDEFYYHDLIGLKVKSGKYEIGSVKNLCNFGAGDIIEISLFGKEKAEMLPFNDKTIIEVNLEEGFVEVNLPEEVIVQDN